MKPNGQAQASAETGRGTSLHTYEALCVLLIRIKYEYTKCQQVAQSARNRQLRADDEIRVAPFDAVTIRLGDLCG